MTTNDGEHRFAEGEEEAPRGVRVMALVRWVLLMAMLAAALFSIAGYVAPRLSGQATTHAGEAKYYCPMHPQITSEGPGECPICHMTLEPIPKERRKSSGPKPPVPEHSTSAPTDAKPGSSGMANPAPASSAMGAMTPSPATSGVPVGTAPIELTLDRVQAINVRTATVQAGDEGGTLRVPAIVEVPEQSRAEVRVRAAGYIESVRVKQVGEKVRAGEALATFYSPDILQAEQELLAIRAWSGSQNDDASAPPARRRLELLGVAGPTLDRVLQTGKAARSVPVTAPIAGYVVKKNVVLGSFVSPETPLFEIADLRKVYVIASVFSHQLPSIAVGDAVRFTGASTPSKTFEAKVDLIYPEIDQTTRTGRVRFQLDNTDLALLPGQFGTAEFGRVAAQQLTIPLDALVDTGNARYVYVVGDGGKFTPRPVEVGEQVNGRWIVLAGLSPGERVVSGATFLIDSESRLQASLAGASP